MTKTKKAKGPRLEDGLLVAMRAIDSQVQRELQRSPSQRETHGVQKWDPYQKRIERVAAFAIERLGTDDISLDSILVLSQAFSKALSIVVDELGESGLGNVRSAYAEVALDTIERDAFRAKSSLSGIGTTTLS